MPKSSCIKSGDELIIKRRKTETSYKTVWDDTKYYANIHGSKLLNTIIDVKFPYPKSLYAVMDCLEAVIHDKDNATILDFFAGSGTTGHAVLELNNQDSGTRKFILCTNNENNICTEVTYPRMNSVINGYEYTGTEKEILFEQKLTYSRLQRIDKTIEKITDI